MPSKREESVRTPAQPAQQPGEQQRQPQVLAEPKPPFPQQHQPKPGDEAALEPRPKYEARRYKPAGKLEGKVAIVTGGDSGIGRAVAVLFAREGADVAISFLPEEQLDADETKQAVEGEGRRCVQLAGDLCDEKFCREVIDRTIDELGHLDVLVSNAAWQNRKESLDDLSDDEFDRTFKTNVYAYYRMAKAALPHLKAGASIIATSSVAGTQGSAKLLDYSATKGAINLFTKSLAQNLAEKGIRVNAVAPGPVWTPLNPADRGLSPEEVAQFGGEKASTPLGRPAQPEEIAPVYVFLASDADSSYITGEIIQESGGKA